ncbi:MAG: class I SAM-dependent methyltransferase [Pseudomonadota bacterium]
MKRILQNYIGARWKPNGGAITTNWFNHPRLVKYMDQCISPETGKGVVGAVSHALRDEVASRAISVGCGSGVKERRLLEAGVVDQFDLFEVSEAYAAAARQGAKEEGFADRVRVIVDDAFSHETADQYDLVYWDHSLHHMLNVDKAVSWSVAALKPGGWLIINDYVGPTRLVWHREEVDFAREFLKLHQSELGLEPTSLKYKNVIDRLKLFLRDPSEAPQSDKIAASFREHCGEDMRSLGGVMIHLCAPFLGEPNDGLNEIYDELISYDREALEKGHNHFSFAAWQKQTAA